METHEKDESNSNPESDSVNDDINSNHHEWKNTNRKKKK